MQRQAMEAQAAATKPSGPNGEVPSVITLADMLPQEGSVPKGAVPAWGGSRPHIISNFEETAADMEGGAHEEGIEEVGILCLR